MTDVKRKDIIHALCQNLMNNPSEWLFSDQYSSPKLENKRTNFVIRLLNDDFMPTKNTRFIGMGEEFKFSFMERFYLGRAIKYGPLRLRNQQLEEKDKRTKEKLYNRLMGVDEL